MSSERTTRMTSTSALLVAALSLGLSAWSVGCRDREPAPAAQGVARETPVAAPDAARAPHAAVAAAKSAPVVVAPAALAPPIVARAAVKARAHADAPSTTVASNAAAASVKRLVVTRGIEKREPMATDALHAGDGPLYAFLELANPGDEPRTVEVTFTEAGTAHEVGHIQLQVPANTRRWRTWGRTVLVDRPGAWTAIVRGADGSELARTAFEIAAR